MTKEFLKKFNVSKDTAKNIRSLVKAFNLEKQEEEGIPQEWYTAASAIGRKSLRYIKNREWTTLKKRYSHILLLDPDDLKNWGQWLLARQEVGHLIDLEPLFPNHTPPKDEEEPKKETHQYVSNKRILV